MTDQAQTPSTSKAVDLALIASFAALIIVFAFVSIPVGTAGVPLVFQYAVIILTGLVLGGRRGFLSAALFLVLGLALPVLAGGRTTLAALGGPTIGYLVGYLLSAAAVGAIAYRALPRQRVNQVLWFTVAALIGLAIQYICGSFGLMWRADMTLGAAFASNTPFLLPDVAKCVLMIVIALGVHAAMPQLLTRTSKN